MTINNAIIYLISINIISLVCMAFDKRQATKRGQRVSEYFFTLLSMLGGFVGIIGAGLIFRHKTRKRSFQLKIIFSILIFILFAYLIIQSNLV